MARTKKQRGQRLARIHELQQELKRSIATLQGTSAQAKADEYAQRWQELDVERRQIIGADDENELIREAE